MFGYDVFNKYSKRVNSCILSFFLPRVATLRGWFERSGRNIEAHQSLGVLS